MMREISKNMCILRCIDARGAPSAFERKMLARQPCHIPATLIDAIRALYVVRNSDKLRHLAAAPLAG